MAFLRGGGKVSLGELTVGSIAFEQVQASLSFLIDRAEAVSGLFASLRRVADLETALLGMPAAVLISQVDEGLTGGYGQPGCGGAAWVRGFVRGLCTARIEATAAAAAPMPLPPSPPFVALVERFERNLSRVLALVLIVVLLAGTLQLALVTAQALLQPSQNWLDGGLIQLLDRLLLLLIGLEVLQNITAYLKDQSIHTEMVLLTALTAVARKVIVMPPGHDKDPILLLGVGAVIVCLAAAYNLLRTNRPSP
jgi:uncharacterized membrane protein (DUF373 family)